MTVRQAAFREKRPPPLDLVSRLERAEERLTFSEQCIAIVLMPICEVATRVTIAELASRASKVFISTASFHSREQAKAQRELDV